METLTDFLPFLEKVDNGYMLAFMFLIVNIAQFFKHKREVNKPLYERVVEGAINRQNDLDQKQVEIMTSLRDEIVRVSEQYDKIAQELQEERERSRILSDKYIQLVKENGDFSELITALRREISEMRERLAEN